MTPGRKKMIAGILMAAIGLGAIISGLNNQDNQIRTIGNPSSDLTSSASCRNQPPPIKLLIWYGCPHCLKLEKAINTAAIDGRIDASQIDFIPIAIKRKWELYSRFHSILKSNKINIADQIEVMSHLQKDSPKTAKEIIESMLDAKISTSIRDTIPNDPLILHDLLYSNEVSAQLKESNQLFHRIKAIGVPAIYSEVFGLIGTSDLMDYDSISIRIDQTIKNQKCKQNQSIQQ